MTVELNTIAPIKWEANYAGVAPVIDITDGVLIGDFAVDTSDNTIWQCSDNTDSASIWVVVGITASDAVRIIAKVNEASGVTAGQVVYLSGATGGAPQASLSDNTDFTKASTLAIANESKSDNQNIVCTIAGILSGIDTSAFAEGDVLYLGITGNMTNVHPTDINAVQRVGHAIRIHASQGSMIVELDPLTIINDHNGILRHQLVNQNAGISASAAYTIVNDADHRVSLSIVGSGYTAVAGIAESLVIYNEGYNKTVNAVDGNFGFEWWTDITDSHNLSSTSKMTLTALGELLVLKSYTLGETNAQVINLVAKASTSDTTPTALTLGGAAEGVDGSIILPVDTAWAFTVHVIAIDTTNSFANSGKFSFDGLAINDGGTVTVVSTTLGSDSTIGTFTGSVALGADATNDALRIVATGIGTDTIKWTASIDIRQADGQ